LTQVPCKAFTQRLPISYFDRTDDATLRAQLAGDVIEPVERDAPPVGAGRFAPAE
jgi:sulfite reductase (ferredoxin)